MQSKKIEFKGYACHRSKRYIVVGEVGEDIPNLPLVPTPLTRPQTTNLIIVHLILAVRSTSHPACNSTEDHRLVVMQLCVYAVSTR